MAYDRYDTSDERSRWQRDHASDDRGPRGREWRSERDREDSGNPDDRGFFGRAADEIGSWFGASDDDHRHRQREEYRNPPRSQSDRHRGDNWRPAGSGDRGYRPMTGDYGRSEREDYGRSQEPYGRDDYRNSSRAGTSDRSDRSRHDDPHYQDWRQRQMESLDREYDDYRREHQERFESDFGNWREQRQQKRGLLGQVREHMEVVGSDDQHIGTVERSAGDRLILAKSDPDSGGAHHSLSCTDIDRVEGDRVILACSAEQARQRWRDETRGRALFEREGAGEAGPRALNRSFDGTYR